MVCGVWFSLGLSSFWFLTFYFLECGRLPYFVVGMVICTFSVWALLLQCKRLLYWCIGAFYSLLVRGCLVCFIGVWALYVFYCSSGIFCVLLMCRRFLFSVNVWAFFVFCWCVDVLCVLIFFEGFYSFSVRALFMLYWIVSVYYFLLLCKYFPFFSFTLLPFAIEHLVSNICFFLLFLYCWSVWKDHLLLICSPLSFACGGCNFIATIFFSLLQKCVQLVYAGVGKMD